MYHDWRPKAHGGWGIPCTTVVSEYRRFKSIFDFSVEGQLSKEAKLKKKVS